MLHSVTSLVGIYTRISDDDAGEQTSTPRQERLCRQWATEQGHIVAEVYEDVGRSAWADNVVRPAYERLLTDVAARRIDAVVVWRLDRLVRSPGEFERFWSACRTAGVAILSATEPVGASDPVSLAIVRLLVTFAGLESDVKGIRMRARNRELAEQGRPPRRGTRHFGFTPDYTIIEDEARLIRDACERVLAGESAYVIAEDWQARGIPTVRGADWKSRVVTRLLSSPALAGDLTYHGEVAARDAWEPIIDRETSAEVRNRLAGQRGHAKRAPGATGRPARQRSLRRLRSTHVRERGSRRVPRLRLQLRARAGGPEEPR